MAKKSNKRGWRRREGVDVGKAVGKWFTVGRGPVGWREIAIGIGGGALVAAACWCLTIYVIATREAGAPTNFYPGWSYVVSIIATMVLVPGVPRLIAPKTPIFPRRDYDGSYIGTRVSRGFWLLLVLPAAAALALALWLPDPPPGPGFPQ